MKITSINQGEAINLVNGLSDKVKAHNIYINAFNEMFEQQQTLNDQVIQFMGMQAIINTIVIIAVTLLLIRSYKKA